MRLAEVATSCYKSDFSPAGFENDLGNAAKVLMQLGDPLDDEEADQFVSHPHISRIVCNVKARDKLNAFASSWTSSFGSAGSPIPSLVRRCGSPAARPWIIPHP